MQPIQLFKLASQQAQYLTVRHSVVAGNIANVNTSGFAAKDVEPFKAVLEASSMRMAATNPAHFSVGAVESSVKANNINGIAVHPSGNSVNLANELSKSSEIKRHYEINTSIVKSVNRMMLMTVRK